MAVMKEKCGTCPFSEDGHPVVRAKVEAMVMSEASQTCHSTGAVRGKRDTHLCRGARDYQLRLFFGMGFIDAPTDEAWDRKRKELGV